MSEYSEDLDDLDDDHDELDEPEETERAMLPGSEALHDAHESYKGIAESVHDHHIGKMENERVKSMLEDHRERLEDMADEARELHKSEYPDTAAPGEGGGAGDEHPLEDVDDEDEDEEDLEEKHARRSGLRRRSMGDDDKRTKALERTLRREEDRLFALVEDVYPELAGLSRKAMAASPRARKELINECMRLIDADDDTGADLADPELDDPLSRKSTELREHHQEQRDLDEGRVASAMKDMSPREQEEVLEDLAEGGAGI